MTGLNRFDLIAPCGLNCGVCRAWLRKRNHCPGCRAPDENKPATRVVCKIKTCESLAHGGFKYCFECDLFPCDNLKHLDRRYRTRYAVSTVENLEKIRDSGIREFVREEKARWTCGECGGTVCMHKQACVSCGGK